MLLIAFLNILVNLACCSISSEWTFSSNPAEFNSHLHRKFIENPNRSYGIMVLYNTLNPKYNCPLCVMGNENIKKVASLLQEKKGFFSSFPFSLTFSSSPSMIPMKLAILEFENGEEIFKNLGIDNVPILSWYPPFKTSFTNQASLRQIGNIDEMYDWIEQVSGIQLKKMSIPLASSPLLIPLLIIFLISIIAIFKKSLLIKLIQDVRTFMFLTITFTTVIMAGQMWNQIRNAWPRGRSGELFFASLQTQFACETQIISILSKKN